MLEAENLGCVRGDRLLFGDVAFRLQAGQALHVAGSNGSGKTSLLRMLCGLAAPSQGEIRWMGKKIRPLREEYFRELIYIGHAPAVKDDLTAVENLVTAVTVSGLDVTAHQAGAALAGIGLAGREDLPARVLSQGQRRRVVLARLLLGLNTPLWVLDEPFTALDQSAVGALKQTMEDHLQTGGMLIYTTHQEVLVAAGAGQKLDLDHHGRTC